MAEALWVQASGVDYSAAEDRKLISSIYTPGVIYGLIISAGSGLAAVVSAGRCIISDGAGGAYLAYFDANTTVASLAGSATNNLYVTIDPTTAQATIVKGSAPTTPYVQIGSATTSASVVTSVSNVRAAADSPATPSPKYLPISGGTLTGPFGAKSLDIPGLLTADSDGVSAPLGVQLGSAANRTACASIKAYRSSVQTIPASTYTKIQFDAVTHAKNDYGGSPLVDVSTTTTRGRFLIPVDGDYVFSGSAHFANQSGTTNQRRLSRLVNFNADGTVRWTKYCTQRAAGGNEDLVSFDALMDCSAGNWVEFQVRQDESHSVDLSTDTFAGGFNAYGCMRLIQAN